MVSLFLCDAPPSTGASVTALSFVNAVVPQNVVRLALSSPPARLRRLLEMSSSRSGVAANNEISHSSKNPCSRVHDFPCLATLAESFAIVPENCMPLPHPWLAGDGLLLGITGGRAVSPAARAPVTCNRGWCRDAQRASTLSARAARRASLPCACVLPSMLHPSHDSTSVEGTGLATTAKARLAAAAEAPADGCRAHHWRPQQVLCFLVLSHSCAIIVQPPP